MFDIVQLLAEWLKPTVSPVQRDHQNHQWPNHRVFTLFYQRKKNIKILRVDPSHLGQVTILKIFQIIFRCEHPTHAA